MDPQINFAALVVADMRRGGPRSLAMPSSLTAVLLLLSCSLGCGGRPGAPLGDHPGGSCPSRVLREHMPTVTSENVTEARITSIEESRVGAIASLSDIALAPDGSLAFVGGVQSALPSLELPSNAYAMAVAGVLVGGAIRWARGWPTVTTYFDAAVMREGDAITFALPLHDHTAVDFAPEAPYDALALLSLDEQTGQTRRGTLLGPIGAPDHQHIDLSTDAQGIFLCAVFAEHATTFPQIVHVSEEGALSGEVRDDGYNPLDCAVSPAGRGAFLTLGDDVTAQVTHVGLPEPLTTTLGHDTAMVMLDDGSVVAATTTRDAPTITKLTRIDANGRESAQGERVGRFGASTGSSLLSDGEGAWLVTGESSGLRLELLSADLSAVATITISEPGSVDHSEPTLWVTAASRAGMRVAFVVALMTPSGDPHCSPPSPEWARVDVVL